MGEKECEQCDLEELSNAELQGDEKGDAGVGEQKGEYAAPGGDACVGTTEWLQQANTLCGSANGGGVSWPTAGAVSGLAKAEELLDEEP